MFVAYCMIHPRVLYSIFFVRYFLWLEYYV